MKIFLTGATGYIGSAVLDAALRANHQITALVRTPQAADALSSRGVTPVLGDLKTVKSYRTAADAHDAYIHTASDSSQTREEVDRKAIETLMGLATFRAKFAPVSFVYTSGIWVLGSNAQPMDETAQPNPGQLLGWRPAHEELILQAAGPNLRTAVIRPGIVYGGNRGIVSDLLKNALNGLIRVIGTGENHWPLVYDRDLADLYVRVASMPNASGIYHANDEGDETVNAIVEGIAGHLSMTPDVRHVPLEEARKKLGAYADALALDQRVRGPRARALGWSPTLHSVGTNVPRLLEEFRRAQERAA
ncbi:MAG TPA: NAD-dependent epimerase/dehydratase family protein [Vicinamibacterales bacterium]|nr:NAD-dependent epimerase/dehydratase family protein [Vicinamibacterales bacterium]